MCCLEIIPYYQHSLHKQILLRCLIMIIPTHIKGEINHNCSQIYTLLRIRPALQNKWPISAPSGFRDIGCMLAVTPSASPQPRRSNTGMIYVPCPGLHSACSPALELLSKANCSSNLSPYMCRSCGAEVREMKMTRPDLIVVSICGSRQDVCLNVYLSICASVSLLSWRRVLCQRVETLWLQSAIMGTDPIQQEYRGFTQEICLGQIASLSQHAAWWKTFLVFSGPHYWCPLFIGHKNIYTKNCTFVNVA